MMGRREYTTVSIIGVWTTHLLISPEFAVRCLSWISSKALPIGKVVYPEYRFNYRMRDIESFLSVCGHQHPTYIGNSFMNLVE